MMKLLSLHKLYQLAEYFNTSNLQLINFLSRFSAGQINQVDFQVSCNIYSKDNRCKNISKYRAYSIILSAVRFSLARIVNSLRIGSIQKTFWESAVQKLILFEENQSTI